jgi:hypothetical protein
MKKLLAGALGVALWCGSALLSAQSNPPAKQVNAKQQTSVKQQTSDKEQMSADMREAIAFERAKDEADARQARLEARHPSVPVSGAENGANREEKDSTPRKDKVKDPGPDQDRQDQ